MHEDYLDSHFPSDGLASTPLRGILASMSNGHPTLGEIAHAIPFRRVGEYVEFCLFRGSDEPHWGFPVIPVEDHSGGAAHVAGVVGELCVHCCRPFQERPIGKLRLSKRLGGGVGPVYLIEVGAPLRPDFDPSENVRWCLTEEVYRVVRRKPLRTLVKVALNLIQAP